APDLGRGAGLAGAISVFKERCIVRLWRGAQFRLGQFDFIFADSAWDVCDGDPWLDVMNP
ncbi:MAG: hypothetical protein WB566_15035, partial [Terriglobales bacterium]